MTDKIERFIKQAGKIVVITGQEAMTECGGTDLWDADNLYRIEKTYGKSPEEMLSAGELTARKAYFYDFYNRLVENGKPKRNEYNLYEKFK